MTPSPLKTRRTFAWGYARDVLRLKLKTSFWWNLIFYGLIFGLIALGIRVAMEHSGGPHPYGTAPAIHQVWGDSDPRVEAPALHLVSQSAPFAGKKKGGCCVSTAQFHRQFRAGRLGVWTQRRKFTRSFHRAWVRSANRHLHYRHLANQYYYEMIHTTNCQSLYNTINCNMRFPSVRYDWTHPADNSTGRKWALRVGWCGAVAVTEYYTAGEATRGLLAVGGKAMAECLPAFLIP